MTDLSAHPTTRLARFVTPGGEREMHIRSSHGRFATHAEAEAAARELADAPDLDAAIVEDGEGGFALYGVDEVHSLLPGGSMTGEVIREAPIVSFVATDPLSGEEQIMGRQAQNPAAEAPTANLPPTPLDRYAERHGKQLDKVLGSEKAAVLGEMNELIHSLQVQGLKVDIELGDDVFESRNKLDGFRNMLHYAHDNLDALRSRSIREIAIVDEWDGVFGTKVDLEYNKKQGTRRLELGDDFLNDWGKSGSPDHDKSLKKLESNLGETLSESELNQRSERFKDLRHSLVETYDTLNHSQQAALRGESVDPQRLVAELDQTLTHLEKEVLPQAEREFKNFSVKQERRVSEHALDRFKDNIETLRAQLDQLRSAEDMSQLELNGRLEKIKLMLVKGVNQIPENRNYIGTYVGGVASASGPSAGLEYSRTLGQNRSTTASLRAGTTSPVQAKGGGDDIMLGLGVAHRFDSRNALLDGAHAGIGVGFSRETPFFIGASAGNSWYLNDYNGLEGQGSVVGQAYATLGTYSNAGVSVHAHKALNSRVDFEGYGEISFWNQAAEAELELALNRDKDIYLTGGIGTNKLIYGGVGFADKYELEVGLGGISFGKDSNNLPGESGWEVGLRHFPIPLPYFRHQRVPGYQFSYNDKSTQYITPGGTFMTIKTDAQGQKFRQAYIPDPQATVKDNQIAYRRAQSKAEAEDLQNAPLREITLGPTGYLTVVEDGEVIVRDGLIQQPMTEAELGILTDQAGVLWYDRMNAERDKVALGTRRAELPFPLYRAVHH
ncbi:MAG: hypothetical protein IGS03_05595 [Candidatus Sericytochromatia bacterium]|nr:hypothetical protein [Candidatus Sericytochromatia bacterium]